MNKEAKMITKVQIEKAKAKNGKLTMMLGFILSFILPATPKTADFKRREPYLNHDVAETFGGAQNAVSLFHRENCCLA